MAKALIEAAAKRDLNTLRSLLKEGSEVDVRNEYGATALMEAAKYGHFDTVSLLLESGANPYVKGESGKNALSFAAMSGHVEVVRRLLSWQYTSPVQQLMELQTDDSGDSPLILAARIGRTQVVELLLGREDWLRSTIDLRDDVIDQDQTSLRHRVVSQVRVRNRYGDTALIEATRQKHSEIVRLLIEEGAEIDISNTVGRTALMVAAAEGNAELTSFLLERGADRNLTDKRGNNALDLAERKGNADVVKLLKPRYKLSFGSLVISLATRVFLGVAMGMRAAPKRPDAIEMDGNMAVASERGLATVRLAQIASQHHSATLLLGESGSGKDFLARYIHKRSSRASGPFRTLNCAALPQNLVESELFGHEKGAFTGATGKKKGIFELAQGGTAFLNEIGDMPLELQTRLLTFLDSYSFQRIGGEEEIEADIRILAATNKDLNKEVQAGAFRNDLYHRLAVWLISVPPLRERIEDLPLIAEKLLADLCERTRRTQPSISNAAFEKLCAHSWEGNIRELRNCMERALILCDGELIEPEHIILDTMLSSEDDTSRPRIPGQTPKIASKRKRTPKPLPHELKALYKQYIDEQGWTRAKLAEHMGVDSSTLKKWFKEAGLPAGKAGRPKKKPGA
ncbi:sigma 54-interacting transcriptional regulator [Thermodesulfobacteriota bacterium]